MQWYANGPRRQVIGGSQPVRYERNHRYAATNQRRGEKIFIEPDPIIGIYTLQYIVGQTRANVEMNVSLIAECAIKS